MKDNSVNTSELIMMANYVLVLPDPQLTSYQFKGRELGLISPDFKYENGEKISIKEKNMSVFGTVYGVPSHLQFNLDKIEKLKRTYTLFDETKPYTCPVNIAVHREIGELTRNSVMFDVDIEIKKGDRVNFSYQAHKTAKEEKMILDTELGEMYLIKYDMLYMVVDENYQPKRMLNGYILVEPDEIETLKEDGKEFIEHSGGLVTLAPKHKLKKTRKTQNGTVIKAGGYCRRFLQQPEKKDDTKYLEDGDRIMYDPRLCKKLELDIHQIVSDKILHLIQRKDIHLVYREGVLNGLQ